MIGDERDAYAVELTRGALRVRAVVLFRDPTGDGLQPLVTITAFTRWGARRRAGRIIALHHSVMVRPLRAR